MDSSANILFLVSDPLDASISIDRDLAALQDGLRQIEAAVRFDTHVAEADAVQGYLERGDRPQYRALHYLGHGFKAEKESSGFLIFERKDGNADALDATRLAYTLSANEGEFKLAIISACHSESVAGALFAVGAEHVLAIEGDKTVYEAAAIAFCRRFYQSLLTGNSLAKACDAGRRAIVNDETMRSLGEAAISREIAKFHLRHG